MKHLIAFILLGGAQTCLLLAHSLDAWALAGMSFVFITAWLVLEMLPGGQAKARKFAGVAFLSVATGFPLSIVISLVQKSISERRGDHLISAILKYKNSRGAYPDTLRSLVPEFVEVIPNSAMGLYYDSPFQYSISDGGVPSLQYRASPGQYGFKDASGAWYTDSKPWRPSYFEGRTAN